MQLYERPARSSTASAQPSTDSTLCWGRSRLLELPAELREIIWTHAVTQWTPIRTAESSKQFPMLRQAAVRLDRFNRPLPAALTRVSRQLRYETLHLYYECNQFELWRPLFWVNDWTFSTLIEWLTQLGLKIEWLDDIVLMYKHESEIDHDIEEALWELGFTFSRPGVISHRCELSDFELTHEALGLPRRFGARGAGRWLVS